MRRTDKKHGTMQGDLFGAKDVGDFWLTRVPALYLAVERYREWVNWDKRVYLSFIRPGDVVLDVGANVGAHTVFFSHLVGSRGRVVSFEPIPENVAAMRALIARRARFDNVTIVESAVGDPGNTATAVLRIPGEDSTQASLQSQSSGSWTGQTHIRTVASAITALDSHPHVSGLERVDFVKVDVEGGELDVLKGGRRSISVNEPLIYCEAYNEWSRSFGYSPATLMAYVASLGYQGARVISSGEVHSARCDSKAPPEWFDTSSDVLFFSGRHAAAVAAFDKRYGVKPRPPNSGF